MNWDMWQALLALFLGTFLSEDAALVSGGVLSSQGEVSLSAAIIACTLGIFVSDFALVLLGRSASHAEGSSLLKRLVPPREKIDPARAWMETKGWWVIFVSRFVPGTRTVTSVAAGWLRVSLGLLALIYLVAAVVWTPLVVGGVHYLGRSFGWFDRIVWWQVLLGLVGLWGAVAACRLAWGLSTNWKARRLAYSRWQRWARWEFWPAWALYVPLAPWFLLLALRHRSATVFTCVNPGIDAGGGLLGESKAAILAGLKASGRVAPWILIDEGTPALRIEKLDTFAAAEGGGWPLVLKPDKGERGSGVVIARTRERALQALAEQPGPMIAQRYVPGHEYGLFYLRHPDEARGRLLAITDKRLIAVEGDGIATLENLILRDERAVCMAPFFLAQHRGGLARVPAPGERVALTELGTHCRGALFLDGGHLETPALLEEVERVSRSFHGFFLGRYDVRSTDAEALQRGEFTVLELNGLTSEPTAIYDPRHTVWHAWAMLGRQWAHAFSIGAANRRTGIKALGVQEIWAMISRRST